MDRQVTGLGRWDKNVGMRKGGRFSKRKKIPLPTTTALLVLFLFLFSIVSVTTPCMSIPQFVYCPSPAIVGALLEREFLFIGVSSALRTALGTYYVLSKHLLKLKRFWGSKSVERKLLKEKFSLGCGQEIQETLPRGKTRSTGRLLASRVQLLSPAHHGAVPDQLFVISKDTRKSKQP